MNRRDLFRGVGSLALSVAPCFALADRTPRLDALSAAIHPILDLRNAHTGEQISGVFFDGNGYRPGQLDAVNWFMRDWREGAARPLDPRLLWALAAVRQAAQVEGSAGRIIVLSGYRTRKTNTALRAAGHGAARNSFHLRARAVDFVIPDVPVALVARYMAWLQVGGIGHYAGNFVHIDTGPERSWNG